MNSASVDLIATDPPFNSKRIHNAPLGSKAAGQRFDDRWKWDDVTDEWNELIATDYPAIKEIIEAAVVIEGGKIDRHTGHIDTGVTNSIAAFLVWMAPRLIEMKRLLKPTGSIYLHCDPEAGHYLKLLMDAIFSPSQFRDEIVWVRASKRAKGSQHKKRTFGRDCDYILHYSATKHYLHNEITLPLTEEEKYKKFPHTDERGRRYNTDVPIFCQPSMGDRPNLCYTYKGVTNPHPSGWRVSIERLKEMDANGEIIWREGKRPLRKSFLKNYKGKPIGCLWNKIPIAAGEERTKWSTQKPWELYQRIVKASSKKGDLVLDPFCGCATTCVAAELEGRRWIGIDIDEVAETVTREQLSKAAALNQMSDNQFVRVKKNPPTRTDIPKISKDKMRLALWKRNGGICSNPYCRIELRVEDTHLDHIIPERRGGADDITNRNILCGNCNARKGQKAWGAFLNEERAKQPHPVVGNYGQ